MVHFSDNRLDLVLREALIPPPAAALALRERETPIIDLEPQANSCLSFLGHGPIEHSTYNAIADPVCELSRNHPAAATLQNLLVAPARIALANLEARLVGS